MDIKECKQEYCNWNICEHYNGPPIDCPLNINRSPKTGSDAGSECINLLSCPLCGSNIFTEQENSDDRITAIYCDLCPYGVEDSTMTLAEIREWHNTRSA